MKKPLTLLTLACVPALTAFDCRSSSSATISQPSAVRYCDQSIPTTGTVSMANSNIDGNAALLIYRHKTDVVSVLQTAKVSAGGSQTLSFQIPWSMIAADRNSNGYILVDVITEETLPAGTTMASGNYRSWVGERHLLARATRAIKICDPPTGF